MNSLRKHTESAFGFLKKKHRNVQQHCSKTRRALLNVSFNEDSAFIPVERPSPSVFYAIKIRIFAIARLKWDSKRGSFSDPGSSDTNLRSSDSVPFSLIIVFEEWPYAKHLAARCNARHLTGWKSLRVALKPNKSKSTHLSTSFW